MLPSLVFNIYKPVGISSYDVIRHFKRALKLKRKDKIGHFGTLDPFAEGVFLVALSRASRLNNYVHDLLPKTYLSYGILGQQSPSGDTTTEIEKKDTSDFFKNEIPNFKKDFIEKKLQEKFLGEYLQAPHKFSASKFEGKKLYEYAREGIAIKKEKVKRYVHKIEVVEFSYPKLVIRFEVSSGTYIRSLFSECANYLGTLGVLEKLVREKIGEIDIEDSLRKDSWPKDTNWDLQASSLKFSKLLSFNDLNLNEGDILRIKNGMRLNLENRDGLYWVKEEDQSLISLGEVKDQVLRPLINF